MRVWLAGLLMLLWCGGNSQVRWDGEAGDGQWSTAVNWTGNSVPLPGDNVILDNTLFNGSYTVTLPGGNTNILLISLLISPGPSLYITLTLPFTNTADPGLTVSGAGDAIILNAGGKLKNSSGATTGSGISVIGTLRINNGGRYIHNTSRGNASIVSQLSTSPGTEYGEFEFDSPSGSATISLSSRHYGTLILSSASNGGTASYIGSGASPATIHGNLLINTGVTFSISMTATFVIHGNWNQLPSCTFNLQNSSNSNNISLKGNLQNAGIITETGSGFPKIEFSGTAMQQISITGTGVIMNSIEFVMNNTQGLTLLSPLVLPYHLQLNNGKIFTTNTNIITLKDGNSTTGASVTSFIAGPLRKIGDETFVFPVGQGNIYAPVSLMNVSNELSTDQFTVSYQRQSPQTISSMNFQSPIDHISYVEYWTVNRDAGNAIKLIDLKVGELSFARDAPTLMVSQWNGSTWINNGQSSFIAGPSSGGFITGELISNSVSDFGTGYFTIATSSPGSINPLPVKFISFEGNKTPVSVELTWRVAEIPTSSTFFEIERSTGTANFIRIGVLYSSSATEYRFHYRNTENEDAFYRIRSFEPPSGVSISPVIMINKEKRFNVKLLPNPVEDYCMLQVLSPINDRIGISFYDALGRQVLKANRSVQPGINQFVFRVGHFTRGMYTITLLSENRIKTQLQFLKK